MIGNMLRDREVQYVAVKDDLTNTWRILDTWHEDLKSLQPEDEIDDETEAVKILTEGEFISIVKEAARTGILANANFGNEEEYNAMVTEKDAEIQDLRVKLEAAELNTKNPEIIREPRSEEYELKEKAMNSILKLVSMADMTNLGRE